MNLFLQAVERRIAIERLELLSAPGTALPTGGDPDIGRHQGRRGGLATASLPRRQRIAPRVRERAAAASAMRAEGLLWTVIAERLGCTLQQARYAVGMAARGTREGP